MQILDGKKTASEIKLEVAEEIKLVEAKGGKIPHLVAVLVGNNGASITYVNAKIAACEKVGMKSTIVRLHDTVTESELLDKSNQKHSFDDCQIDYLTDPENLDLLLSGIETFESHTC